MNATRIGVIGVAIVGGLIALATLIWRNDILQAMLDPEMPYAVYQPPPPPDYSRSEAWALLPGTRHEGDPPVDVFFVHPTTFDGGRHWNGPLDAKAAARLLNRVMLPNYAGPFSTGGRVFAPRYRQASLYSSLTLFDDAVDARTFAYNDVRAAFAAFQARLGPETPFAIVGVEQGGTLAARLLRDEIETTPGLRRRLVAAYLIETVVPAAEHGAAASLPACVKPVQTGRLIAWISAPVFDFGRMRRIMNRSLVWSSRDRLTGLGARPPLCVNPLLGVLTDEDAPPRFNRGAANATGLEWGVRPGFLARQVGARCVDGILRVTRPRSASLSPSGDWPDRLRAPAFNLFWADLENDLQVREAAFLHVRAG